PWRFSCGTRLPSIIIMGDDVIYSQEAVNQLPPVVAAPPTRTQPAHVEHPEVGQNSPVEAVVVPIGGSDDESEGDGESKGDGDGEGDGEGKSDGDGDGDGDGGVQVVNIPKSSPSLPKPVHDRDDDDYGDGGAQCDSTAQRCDQFCNCHIGGDK